MIIISCKKTEFNREIKIAGGLVTEINVNSATASSEIIDVGDGIMNRGHCWSTEAKPDITDYKTELGATVNLGSFKSILTDLYPSTVYFIRAYATNDDMIVYGNEQTFTTLPTTLPVVATGKVRKFDSISVIIDSEILSMGDGIDTIYQYGYYWSDQEEPTMKDSVINMGSKTEEGLFALQFNRLEPGTTYYFRAYAINKVGVSYGETISFTTDLVMPRISTSTVQSIEPYGAISGGEIHYSGGGDILQKGICWNTSPYPTIDNDILVDKTEADYFESTITNLSASTIYYVRAFARNAIGTAYGQQIAFQTTEATTPSIETALISNNNINQAVISGIVNNDGGSTILSQGICWSSIPNPTINDSIINTDSETTTFTCNISMSEIGIYYARAFATNIIGTEYGVEVQIHSDMLEDYEGNTYRWVQIGEQIWMSENLRSTVYANGEPIPIVHNSNWNSSREALVPKACAYYNNNEANAIIYGVYYNWHAVMNDENSSAINPSGVQGVCPSDWHVPSQAEWQELRDYLINNGYYYGADELYIAKSLATITGWIGSTIIGSVGNDTLSNNRSGFSGYPSGEIGSFSKFSNQSGYAYWWSTSENSSVITNASGASLSSGNPYSGNTSFFKTSGKSVRCVKD